LMFFICKFGTKLCHFFIVKRGKIGQKRQFRGFFTLKTSFFLAIILICGIIMMIRNQVDFTLKCNTLRTEMTKMNIRNSCKFVPWADCKIFLSGFSS